MIVIGLTGGIGMGKSAVARMFGALGAAVSDADRVVHRLWETEPALQAWVAQHYPDCIEAETGAVNRKQLGQYVFHDNKARKALEALIHPLVEAEERRFAEQAAAEGKEIIILEVPLLFETGADQRVDLTITVSAPLEIQRARVLSREGMDEATLERILARQWTDEQRCEQADLIIPTSGSEAETQAVVEAMWQQLLLETGTLRSHHA